MQHTHDDHHLMDDIRAATSLDQLLALASDRRLVRPADARSGATFERLTIDGQPYFLKVLSADSDWIMRVTGNTTNWEYRVWQAGLYDRCPPGVDHAMATMVLEPMGAVDQLSMLMHDRGDDLIPPGDEPLSIDEHRSFIQHMAEFHAAYAGWRDTIGLSHMAGRFRFFAPATIELELRAADVPGPIAVAHQGWARLPDRAPDLHRLVTDIHREPQQLVDALATTPTTFIAGDWKLGNLGRRTDGQTVLLDWAYPGEAPPCWDLMWYLALNRSRLPETKEATIAAYRVELDRHGMDTSGWFERQLGLCTVGIMATFAWEKAVGDDVELAWWQSAALEGTRWLG
jgi:hypothetical protein